MMLKHEINAEIFKEPLMKTIVESSTGSENDNEEATDT